MMYEEFLKIIVLMSISIFVYLMNFLDLKALILAFVMGFIILFMGGWGYFILLMCFLIVGSFMTKFATNYDKALRSWPNVLANGFWPTISVFLIYLLNTKSPFFIFYLGSLNAMFSDTLSTEVGMVFGGQPRLITSPHKVVDKGMSGGVTLSGTVGGLLASFAFALLSLILFKESGNVRLFLSVSIGGFLSSIVDSILGSTIQGKYKCGTCSKIVESKYHCDGSTTLISGYEFINNHTVNFLSSLIGGLITILLFKSFYMF